jgi:hypothetical protein
VCQLRRKSVWWHWHLITDWKFSVNVPIGEADNTATIILKVRMSADEGNTNHRGRKAQHGSLFWKKVNYTFNININYIYSTLVSLPFGETSLAYVLTVNQYYWTNQGPRYKTFNCGSKYAWVFVTISHFHKAKGRWPKSGSESCTIKLFTAVIYGFL